jgi:hypothetical protein
MACAGSARKSGKAARVAHYALNAETFGLAPHASAQIRPGRVIHLEGLRFHKADAGTILRSPDALASKSHLPRRGRTRKAPSSRSRQTVGKIAADRSPLRAEEMDTNNDGSISKREFLAYTLKRYQRVPKTHGMVRVDVMAKAFARGNNN